MGGVFYVHDSETGKQESLGTRDRAEAMSLLNARNESVRQPQLNLQIAKAYLAGTDSGVSTRTWQNALDAIVETKNGSTKDRWRRAAKETALDLIRDRVIIETQAEQVLACLKAGTVSTNVHLRKLHNFCLSMNWLPWPLIPKRLWPEVRFQPKRAITIEEHQLIIEREQSPERRNFYELCWHLGGSPTLWRITCMETDYPGLWMRWFKHQCVAVGWPPDDDFRLHGKPDRRWGWGRARKALKDIKMGDAIVVALRGRRIGRLGWVTGKAIEDSQWNPLLPANSEWPKGQMGRRVLVRWDLTHSPDDPDLVVRLPEEFASGGRHPTLSRVHSKTVEEFQNVMADPANWVGLIGHFGYERALSDYIALYPHRLEDGLVPYPDKKIRERVFEDRSRLDVLLADKNGVPVIVECKQESPTVEAIRQLRHYIKCLKKETRDRARGILVHGGARKLHMAVRRESLKSPRVEIIQYRLDVDFSPSY